MKLKNFSMINLAMISVILLVSCNGNKQSGGALGNSDAANQVYVAPGTYDEYYSFLSGGFSGQLSVYGLPSGRLFKVIDVFSQDPQTGYGYSEETIPMLETTHGFLPWGDAHHPELSQTDGVPDGRWIFINDNNTPRVARIDLTTFETAEILELPNSAGNHSSPFTTQNTDYIVAGTRFSVPIPQVDMPIENYKGNFKGALSFIKVDPETGHMNIAFQILMPGWDFDLAHSGKGPSDGWTFFSSYNTEEANSLLEINASQRDKDFIAAINWKKAEEYIAQGKAHEMAGKHFDCSYDENTHTATNELRETVQVLIPDECPGLVYLLPTPKSPHGVDVDPSGEYIIGSGKLSADITAHSFSKMMSAIENESFDGDAYGIPILKYDEVLAGVVKSGGLGPLHTEFDDKGNGYTSFFISSEVVKWKVGTWEVLDRAPSYYSIGHLSIPGGDSRKPWGKYLLMLNKITKDRFLPTGPELCQSCQLYDISGDKMKLLLDFPTIGEPHYGQSMPADIVMKNSKKIYKLDDNQNEYAAKGEGEARVVRNGKRVDVYMTTIRSHFAPDNIEGIMMGDKVYFHITNIEQDWDIPHGFAMIGNNTSELLIMPGQTKTITWEPELPGVFPFYCSDFCSALHQEMQGYVRVSAAGANTPVRWWTGSAPEEE